MKKFYFLEKKDYNCIEDRERKALYLKLLLAILMPTYQLCRFSLEMLYREVCRDIQDNPESVSLKKRHDCILEFLYLDKI